MFVGVLFFLNIFLVGGSYQLWFFFSKKYIFYLFFPRVIWCSISYFFPYILLIFPGVVWYPFLGVDPDQL